MSGHIVFRVLGGVPVATLGGRGETVWDCSVVDQGQLLLALSL